MAERTDEWTAGEAYERFMGRWSRELAPVFLGSIRVPSEGDALDVGCGTGALSAELLRRTAGAVVGVDPSAAYVRFAREALGPTDRFDAKVGSATSLPFEDGRFDLVASSLVLNFVDSPLAAVSEMARVCRQGGLVACSVWDYAEGMQFLRVFWDGASELFPWAREFDEGVRFPLCAPKPLKELFEQGGLLEVETQGVTIPTVFARFDDYWDPFLSAQGPAGAFVASLSSDERDSLRELLRRRLAQAPTGQIELTARAWIVSGRRA